MGSLNYKELLEIANANCKRLTKNFRKHVCSTEAEFDLYDLIDAFHDLDSEFNLLLGHCYLAPLHESIESEPPYMEQYHRFFEQFNTTVRALVTFFTKYSKNKAPLNGALIFKLPTLALLSFRVHLQLALTP